MFKFPLPRTLLWFLLLPCAFYALDSSWETTVYAASVIGTRHDLSTTGVDPYSDRACVFCHTPHLANTTLPIQAPLWNRYVDLSKTFVLYASATLNAVPENPNTTNSMLCLGCHDGTLGTAIVNGYVGSDKHDLVNAPGPGGVPDMTSYPNCRYCHGPIYGDPPPFWLGLDLSDDHPIAIPYPSQTEDPELRTPPDSQNGWPNVPLFFGRVECASCHDPHDPTFTPFLTIANTNSALCLTCHIK